MEIAIGSLCRIDYFDAGYSYRDLLAEGIGDPPILQSFGRLRRLTNDLVDLSIEWAATTHSTRRGIVVPRAGSYGLSRLSKAYDRKLRRYRLARRTRIRR